MATKQTPEEEIAALKKQLADQAKEHGDALRAQAEETAAKDAIIDGQAEALAAATAQGASALSVVTHEKQRYQVLAGQFTLDGKLIQHAELKSNPELVKRLIEEESGLLHLLEEPAQAEA